MKRPQIYTDNLYSGVSELSDYADYLEKEINQLRELLKDLSTTTASKAKIQNEIILTLNELKSK
jgi:hypothetical protein